MALKIYNSLTRKKEDFNPDKYGKIGIYVCGPTVYDEPHIGHARSAYIFDVIVKYLKYRFGDKKVLFIRNVTDIDDKIIERARREPGDSSLDTKVKIVAEKYLKSYHEDMALLGLSKPNKEPKATETIKDMVSFIKVLIDKDFAYEASGDVYFSVRKYKEYGKLSKQSIDQMAEGSRLAKGERKKDALDFTLWKASKEGEPSWKSPWGDGRPGWHIECSVMSTKFLKDDFVIHGGGLDLIFPHHENEIAQTVCAGKRSADYWMHNELLTIDDQKMAKSLGNFITIKNILKKYHPEILKMFFLSAHYRSPIDFTYGDMDNIAHARGTFYRLFERIDSITKSSKSPVTYDEAELSVQIKKPKDYKELFENAMDDDFNMPAALGYFYMISSGINRIIDCNKWNKEVLEESKKLLIKLGKIFGLFEDENEFKKRKEIDPRIEKAIKARNEARKNRDYKTADKIRKELLTEGVTLEDTKEGTVWRKAA